MGKKEKIPPPPLLMIQTKRGREEHRCVICRKLPMSCAAATSPMMSRAGFWEAHVQPAAVASTPSIPEAPRFTPERIHECFVWEKRLKSRMGILLERKMLAFSGRCWVQVRMMLGSENRLRHSAVI